MSAIASGYFGLFAFAGLATNPLLVSTLGLGLLIWGFARAPVIQVWVPPDWTVREAHDCMDRIEEDLQRRFPGTEILIHLDPEGHTDRETMLSSDLTERAT